MDAMDYEYLVRRVYGCGRYGVAGADADIFRRYEHAERAYTLDLQNIKNNQMRISTQSIETLEQEYYFEGVKVWRFVQDAVNTALMRLPTVITTDETEILLSLIVPFKNDPAFIAETISKANAILANHKIYPG